MFRATKKLFQILTVLKEFLLINRLNNEMVGKEMPGLVFY